MSFPIPIPPIKTFSSDKLVIYRVCTQYPYCGRCWHPPMIQLVVAQLAGPSDWHFSEMVGERYRKPEDVGGTLIQNHWKI